MTTAYPFALLILLASSTLTVMAGAIIVLAMFLCALGYTTISWKTHTLMIGACITLFGIAQGTLMPSIMVWTGLAVPASFRGRITSYLGTFGFIGQFLSPIIFRPLVLIRGPQSVFLTAGLTPVPFFFSVPGLHEKKRTACPEFAENL